jgi:hypothetical protein
MGGCYNAALAPSMVDHFFKISKPGLQSEHLNDCRNDPSRRNRPPEKTTLRLRKSHHVILNPYPLNP